jgi:allantoate deiminase
MSNQAKADQIRTDRIMADQKLLDRARRAIADCRLIAGMTEEPGRTTRRFLTPPVRHVHAHLIARMQSLGMSVRVDAIGNLRGLWQPSGSHAKRLLIGSHIDTVPSAGAYDGILGVTLALELIQNARERELLPLALPFAIEVIAFSEEEGVRYAVPFLGSRALAGSFDQTLLALEDADGVRMDAAIRAFGLDPEKIGEAALDPDKLDLNKIDAGILGFFEMHIEQGPVLEAEDLQLAVVEGIVGQTRLEFRFTGQANHAGTTPMHLRHDALTAAAEWIVAVESIAGTEAGLVATVGKLDLQPNAANVVPGEAALSLDVRHMSDLSRGHWVRYLVHAAQSAAHKRGVELEWREQMDQPAVEMDPRLTAELAEALQSCGFPARRMPSGAGHDAMVMAARVPAAMLFLRSPGGISHHPDESVREQDVEAALRAGARFLERLATSVG